MLTLKSFGSGSGFSSTGGLIPQKDFIQLQFPEDLYKTNLRIVSSSIENPFEWAGRLEYNGYTCTGGVVALPGYRTQDRALVLTAGHCLQPNNSFLNPNEAIVDQLLDGEMYFNFPRPRKIKLPNGEYITQKKIHFRKIIFASFDVVDLALLEMNETYEQLEYGAQKPPLLRRHDFKNQKKITMFGIPDDENYKSQLFHMATCNAHEIRSSQSSYGRKDGMKYSLFQQIMTICTLFPGMSGGYVRNEYGDVIGANGGLYVDNYSYYSDIAPLLNCATDEARFSLSCLDKLKLKIETWDKTVSDKYKIKL